MWYATAYMYDFLLILYIYFMLNKNYLSVALVLALLSACGTAEKRPHTHKKVVKTERERTVSEILGDDSAAQPVAVSEVTRSNELSNVVYFGFDTADITDEYADVIKRNANTIKGQHRNKSGKIHIAGHCDERGTQAYNMALGLRRANAVKQLLVKYGVQSKHIHVKSYGKNMPAVQGDSEEIWKLNRRAEISVK
jgi:peptidoglycan-associated lipoprotein